jgi:transcriptional regulator with XRE-family HTH domain
MDADLKAIGQRVKKVRNHLGFLQKDFAEKLEISPSSLCDTEIGQLKPRFHLLYNISKNYKVSLMYLLHGKGGMFMHEEEELFRDSEILGAHRAWFRQFISFFEKSPMFRHAMMAYFFTYLNRSDKLMESDMEKEKARRKEEKLIA